MTVKPQTPTNDDEARDLLRQDKDELVGANLVGIFNLKRSEGIPLIEAYRQALVAHLEAAGYQFDEQGRMVSQPPRELPRFIFVGDDDQLDAIETACKEIKLPIVRQGRYLGFVTTDEIKFKAALIWIFDKRVNGWWLQQNALIEHNVCTNAQFEAAYYAALAAQTS